MELFRIRQESAAYPDGVFADFGYDERSNMTSTVDQRGETTFTYDALSRLLSETGLNGQGLKFVYDELGRRKYMTTGSGSSAGYGLQPWGTSPYGGAGAAGLVTYFSYDAASRMVSLHTDNAEIGATYYDYDRVGSVIAKKLGCGAFAYFDYDAANRVTQILNSGADAAPIAYFEYDYDAVARVNSCRHANGDVIYYSYDNASRLVGEEWVDAGMSPLESFEYDYDAVGNRTYQKQGSDETYYEYNGANAMVKVHEIPADVWSYFEYDNKGNCTVQQEPGGTSYFEYTSANLVKSIKYGDGTMNYFYYDALQRRYAAQDTYGLAYFTWDTNGMDLLQKRDAGGEVLADIVHGYSSVPGIGSVAAIRIDGEVYYLVFDHRGSVVAVLNSSGEKIASRNYNAFGEVINETGDWSKIPFGYQSNWLELKDSGGKYLLSKTRIYDTEDGRFLQRDSFTFGPDDKRLLYAGMNYLVDVILGDKNELNKLIDDAKIIYGRNIHIQPEVIKSYFKKMEKDEIKNFIKENILEQLRLNPCMTNLYIYAKNNPVSNADPSGNLTIAVLLTILVAIGVLVALSLWLYYSQARPIVWRLKAKIMSGTQKLKLIKTYRKYATAWLNNGWHEIVEDKDLTKNTIFYASDAASVDDLLGASMPVVKIKTITINKGLLHGGKENDILMAAVVAHELGHQEEGLDEHQAYLLANELIRYWDIKGNRKKDEKYKKWVGDKKYKPDNWEKPHIYGRRMEVRDYPRKRTKCYTEKEDKEYALK